MTDQNEEKKARDGTASELTRLLGNSHYMCEMCGEVYEKAWKEEEALAEAAANGFDPEENPDDYAIICDYCYKKTPWGMADA